MDEAYAYRSKLVYIWTGACVYETKHMLRGRSKCSWDEVYVNRAKKMYIGRRISIRSKAYVHTGPSHMHMGQFECESNEPEVHGAKHMILGRSICI